MITVGMEDQRANLHLVKLDRATQMLSECKSVPEAAQIASLAAAAALYAKEAKLGLDAINHATEIKLRAERLAGQIMQQLKKEPGKRTDLTSSNTASRSEYQNTLDDSNTTRQEAHRWQKLAAIPDEEFDGRIANTKAKNERVTTAAVLAITAAVDHDGDTWRTPAEWIERCRAVLGQIELDPASSHSANELVKALVFFNASDDGLSREWTGRVFLNPPYSFPLVEKFADKLLLEYADGRTQQAIVLVNSATDSGWWQKLANTADALFLTSGRIGFLDATGKARESNRCGQTFFFFGFKKDEQIARIKASFTFNLGLLMGVM